VRRFAALKPAAGDFRIFWDNAYAVHDLAESGDAEPGDTEQDPAKHDGTGNAGDTLLDLRTACNREGNPDIYYMFASTSKVTFAGGGIAALATSENNLAEIAQHVSLQNIGPDKVNQLRHVAFLRDIDGVREHMRKQAALIAPKFKVVLDTLEQELEGLNVAHWTRPRGGYFISFDGLPGTAARTVELAAEAGVVLTGAGATFPYGTDHRDENIRIAPTYPSVEELALASELFCICVRIAAIEKLLA
jgi:DNA-binding transcriptional MocR family regulator